MTETLPDPRPTKGEETRRKILDTALELFKERGYEETTMRAISEKAEVAVGNAYYYFRSKEHLIQGFYAASHEDHLRASAEALAVEKDLKKRLRAVLLAKIETSQPYHRFAGILFKSAADPNSPLSPFSPESSPVRQACTELFGRVLSESKVKVPKDLAEELPNLLWLYQMGIILFWIHDSSPNARRSRLLVEHTVDIVARLITLASAPLLSPVRKRIVKLLLDLRERADEVGKA